MSNAPSGSAAHEPSSARPAAARFAARLTARFSPRSGPLSASDDTLWASLSHFGGVIGFLPSLVIYLALKDRGTLTRQEAKEALNWQITFTILYLAFSLVLAIIGGILFFTPLAPVGAVLGWLPGLIWLGNVALSIVAGLRVSAAGGYRYPVSIRLIR
ncbi:MAG: hypothetical protein JWM51_1440 [Microbacteriaceae bacterium]|jgi:uncharacterized Tic20 family protein|nr:hypothetical protein [Microbacteriaceae bacterium]